MFSLPAVDRGQGLNHCICDVSHLLKGLQRVQENTSSLREAVNTYEKKMISRGQEEVRCSVDNGVMLHDWEKIQQSPVFRRGFKPMNGNNRSDETPRLDKDGHVEVEVT
jgi:2-polyprenyl-6-methoxyphenol hydroxylase-like FAD-dependent oxidoreductase